MPADRLELFVELHDSRAYQLLQLEKLSLEYKLSEFESRLKSLERKYADEVIINNRLVDKLREYKIPFDRNLIFKVE